MKLLIVALLVPLASLVSSCQTSGEAADRHAFAGLEALDFVTVQSVSVAKILRRDDRGPAKSLFGKYRLSTEWREVDPAGAAAIGAAVREALAAELATYTRSTDPGERVRLTPFCVPNPGFAVRLQTENGTRDLAICLECGHIYMRDRNSHEGWIWMEKPLTAKFAALYQACLGP